jgi:uncharacterized phiE125 gp8 family phage protein
VIPGIKVITDVQTEPVALADLRTHCHVTAYGSPLSHPHDSLLQSFQSAARDWAETFCQRSFAPKTLELALDAFPEGGILLRRGPATSIVSVKYIDEGGSEQTLASNNYMLDDYSDEPWLLPAVGTEWPRVQSQANAVKVRYIAGLPSAALGAEVKTAIAMVTAHLYENRSQTTPQVLATVPFAAQHLLQKHRVMGI